jgi:hypothetical protein
MSDKSPDLWQKLDELNKMKEKMNEEPLKFFEVPRMRKTR